MIRHPLSAAILLALVAAAPSAAERPRAAGGVRLVEAAETAPVTVVAEVIETAKIDLHGHSARLRVEVPLQGPAVAGQELRIAWEELAPSRAPRFAKGERVLLSLERLPGASIWQRRFPDATERTRILSVAMGGEAFLRRPSGAAVGILQHYLPLGPEERRGPTGVGYLVDLASAAGPPLAFDALRRLSGVSDLDEMLGARSGTRLVQALLRTDVGEAFEDALVALIGRHRLESTRPALEALVAAEEPPPAIVFVALAELDQGIAPERVELLLAQGPARHRQVAARFASGPEAEMRLARLVRSDPDPGVRAQAIDRLFELRGVEAVDPVLPGLGDVAPEVRLAAIQGLGALGAPSVPVLRRVLEGNDPEAARSAVAALALNGSPEAHTALVEVAETSQDEALRGLANIALGRPIGHGH